MSKNSRLVYSTDQGKIKPEQSKSKRPPIDGFIRIQRETKGRKGAGVILISGLDMSDKDLKAMSIKLKQICSSGGTLKDGVIEIQGDHRDAIKNHLEKQGLKTKLIGG